MTIETIAPHLLAPDDARWWTQSAIDEMADGPYVPGYNDPRCITAHTVPDAFGELPSVAYLCLDGTWRVQGACRLAMVVRLPDDVALDVRDFAARTICGQPLARPCIRRNAPPPCGGHDCEGLRA